MKIYLLMFLYVFCVGGFIKTISPISNYRGNIRYNISMAAAFLVVALPVFFIGMRTEFNDTTAYITGFRNVTTNFSQLYEQFENSKGFIWLIYEWIIKKYISTDPSVFLFITALIQMAAVVKMYRKYSLDYSFSILLFFLSCTFLYTMGGIRQFMALSILMFFSDYIFENKPFRFAIVVIFASFIHVSAIVWLPIIFVVHGRPGNVKTLLVAILVIIAILYLNQFTDLLTETLEGTLYEGYTTQFAMDDGANIMHSLISFIPIGIWLLGYRLVNQSNDEHVNVLINISIIGFMLNLLAHFTSGILVGRMPIFFTIFNYMLLPWLFENVFEKRSASLIKIACITGYSAYALYYMHSMNISYISSVLNF